jgi:hypothetical protein
MWDAMGSTLYALYRQYLAADGRIDEVPLRDDPRYAIHDDYVFVWIEGLRVHPSSSVETLEEYRAFVDVTSVRTDHGYLSALQGWVRIDQLDNMAILHDALILPTQPREGTRRPGEPDDGLRGSADDFDWWQDRFYQPVDRVFVDIRITTDVVQAFKDLRDEGMEFLRFHPGRVEGWIPAGALDDLTTLDCVSEVTEVEVPSYAIGCWGPGQLDGALFELYYQYQVAEGRIDEVPLRDDPQFLIRDDRVFVTLPAWDGESPKAPELLERCEATIDVTWLSMEQGILNGWVQIDQLVNLAVFCDTMILPSRAWNGAVEPEPVTPIFRAPDDPDDRDGHFTPISPTISVPRAVPVRWWSNAALAASLMAAPTADRYGADNGDDRQTAEAFDYVLTFYTEWK